MRDIRFRLWDEKTKQMIHSTDFNMFYEFFEQGCLDEDEAMQYTGVKDKNDKEIYEFDIVKCKRFYLKPMVEGPPGTFHSPPEPIVETGEEIGIVFFNSVTLGWGLEFRRYDDFEDLSHYCASFGPNHRVEVVGNTFANSDMLKEFRNSDWASL